MKVSKSANEQKNEQPKLSVNDRIENASKFDQLVKRREVLKQHKDTYEKFRLSDTGFSSKIILENEQGVQMPIRNPEALQDIYPYLTKRIDEALERVDAEILEFTV